MFQSLKNIRSNKIEFTIRDVDLSIVNSVRRIILSEIPLVAFAFDPYNTEINNINITKNIGVLHNEFIAHRISLIPIYLTENEVNDFDPGMYVFKLHKKNNTSSVLNVTSNDFEVYKNNVKVPSHHLFPKNDITNDYILITKLKPNLYNIDKGDELEVECTASKDIAKTHSRWMAVSQCSFYNAIDNENAEKALKEKLHNVTDPKTIEIIRNKFNTLDIYRHFKKNRYDEPNEFLFTIESECKFRPSYLFFKGLKVLIEKLNIFSGNLDKYKISMLGNDLFQVEVTEENHTLLNVLQALIYNKQFRGTSGPQISYIGIMQPHPLDQIMYLKMKFIEKKTNEDLKTFLKEMVVSIIEDIRVITLEWIKFSALDKTDIDEVKSFT